MPNLPTRGIPNFASEVLHNIRSFTLRFTSNITHCLGGDGLKSAVVLSDKQHVICVDSSGSGFLYNVLGAKLVKELGKIDIKEEVMARNKQEFIPNWFSADVKTGVSTAELAC